LPLFPLRFQPQLHKPADGFWTTRQIGLSAGASRFHPNIDDPTGGTYVLTPRITEYRLIKPVTTVSSARRAQTNGESDPDVAPATIQAPKAIKPTEVKIEIAVSMLASISNHPARSGGGYCL
jgi:hypothetical protein